MASAGSSAFRRFLNSETGPKTVHFWAPVMKWALVVAGASEMARPVEKVSATQQLSLFATGAIWTRWSMVITPKNYLLASVNFFLGGVSIVQICRIYKWRSELGDSPSQVFKYMLDMEDDKKAIKESVEEVNN
ncbi:mitochondrial pyruvate carrier [Martiniozyma asiatica (nom. inval.)]|nr:mitochondrial pyruvate carrier [Martiniozyma asiatica]